MRTVNIDLGEREIEAELADNFFSRMKGLSFRSSGKMLFSFPRDVNASIDMMFLSRPLYLYFLNSGKEVIEVRKAEPWSWNPLSWKLYGPDENYRYLLESFEELEIEEGERLQFEI
jgi:uncharacterized membrane protein (UPF0127 family)